MDGNQNYRRNIVPQNGKIDLGKNLFFNRLTLNNNIDKINTGSKFFTNYSHNDNNISSFKLNLKTDKTSKVDSVKIFVSERESTINSTNINNSRLGIHPNKVNSRIFVPAKSSTENTNKNTNTNTNLSSKTPYTNNSSKRSNTMDRVTMKNHNNNSIDKRLNTTKRGTDSNSDNLSISLKGDSLKNNKYNSQNSNSIISKNDNSSTKRSSTNNPSVRNLPSQFPVEINPFVSNNENHLNKHHNEPSINNIKTVLTIGNSSNSFNDNSTSDKPGIISFVSSNTYNTSLYEQNSSRRSNTNNPTIRSNPNAFMESNLLDTYEILLPLHKLSTDKELDIYFSYYPEKTINKGGYPNLGNTCYLNVALNILKTMNKRHNFLNLFDLNDDILKYLYIVLKYWDPNNKLISKCLEYFVQRFFEFNKNFKLNKGNDTISFINETLNMIFLKKYNIEKIGLYLDSKLIGVEDNKDYDNIIKQNYRHCEINSSLFFHYCYLYDFLSESNEFETYFSLTYSVFLKNNSSISKYIKSKNIIYFPMFLTIKLTDYQTRDYQFESRFQARDFNDKIYEYELIAVSFITANGKHTYCVCKYDSSWYHFDDSSWNKVSLLNPKNAYSLHYHKAQFINF